MTRRLRLCDGPGCEKLYAPREDVHRFCSSACRKRSGMREEGERKVIAAAFAELGDQERRDPPPLPSNVHAPNRLTGLPRECRCVGDGGYERDDDGDPVCQRCGGPVAEVESTRPGPGRRQLRREVEHVMRADAHGASSGIKVLK
jgi:hypothetical protein